MGEDLPGDPDGTPAGPPETRLDYRFRKPIDHVFAIGTPRKTITATEGEKSFADERILPVSTLNEDPGLAPDQEPDEPLNFKWDELFAVVSLWRAAIPWRCERFAFQKTLRHADGHNNKRVAQSQHALNLWESHVERVIRRRPEDAKKRREG